MSAKLESCTLHFDLSVYKTPREFTLLCGDGREVRLQRYADCPGKLDEHRARNRALGMISEREIGRITHFCEEALMSAEKISMRRVVFPSLDDHPLPEIAMAFFYSPRSHIAAAHARFYRRGRRMPMPYALSHYGFEEEAYNRLLAEADGSVPHAVHFDARLIAPPGVTAQTIVLNHPELGSINPGVMQFVKEEYLNPSENPEMSDLVQYIQNSQPGEGSYTWYNKGWAQWSENADGTGPLVPAQVDTDIVYKDGEKVTNWPQAPGQDYQGMPTYDLTDSYDPPAGDPANPSVIEAASPVVRSTLISTKNDDVLNGLLWTKQDGVTDIASTSVSAPPGSAKRATRHVAPSRAAMAAADAATGFALKSQTSTYGVESYDLAFDFGKQELTVPLKNWPSRYLGAYVEFRKQDGTVIPRKDIPNWPDMVPFDFLIPIMQPSPDKNYLDWLSSGNAVFGVPVPPLTQITNLKFPWPQEASNAQLLLGGLGCASGFKDWDSDVDVVGTMGTGIVNYGTGTIMLLVSVYFINPFIAGLKGDAKIGFYAIAGVIGVSALVIGVAERDTKWGKMILSKLANIAASALFGAVSTRVIQWAATAFLKAFFGLSAAFMAQLTAAQAVEAVPVAGWALRVASIAADIASLTATTIECVLSPATYSYEILRTMDLTVTVNPDPTHGKDGFKPVWPAVADHYVIQVKYPSANSVDGGTTYTLAGPMPGQHDAPITVTFPGIPAGGKISITASIYSDSDWLAGSWNSGWIDAKPDAQGKLSAEGAIVEQLVPLTPTTSYHHKQTIAYDSKHFWQVAAFSVDSALVPAFDKGGTPDTAIKAAFAANGNSLSSQATITVNTPLQSWTVTDGGTVFQVIAKQIFAGQVFTLSFSSYAATLNAGGATPSSVQDAFAAQDYPLPPGTQITVVTPNVRWTIALPGSLPLYQLDAAGSLIDVKQTGYALPVQNTAQPAPPLPSSYPLPQSPTGNALGALQNIIINDQQFQLGYAYLASGQNMPIDNQTGVTNAPMYAMQSVSTLGQPQDQIYVPTKGFSLPTFITYDQFGLTPLFVMPMRFADDLQNGPVPASVVTEFGKFGYSIPAGAEVTVLEPNKEWLIGVPGEDPIYQLRVSTAQVGGQPVQQIGVFDYPIPGLDNFFLEPQPAVANQPLNFFLRGVKLDLPPGEYSFSYSTPEDSEIWGIFQNKTPFQEMAVHPNGYVVGLDNANAKMFTLKLPGAALPPDQAPLAMPLAGKGGREGLLDSPQAMTIAADGRVLVLETGTQYLAVPRIQAFDVRGNPVPSFSVGQPNFQIIQDAATIIDQLDQQQVSPALIALFQQNITPALAAKAVQADNLDGTVTALNAGTVDDAFVATMQFFQLVGPQAKPADFTVSVTTPGALWVVTDTVSHGSYDVRFGPDISGFDAIQVYALFGLSVLIRSEGFDWKLTDSVNAMTFEVTKALDSDTLTVQQLSSYMPLRQQQVSGALSYLDIATETKGYIYVLSVINNNYNATKNPADLIFQLDIYNPDGSPLLEKPQPGVNAGKITVDQYRSLFSLNFNVVIGPDTRTEPGVSQWIPSTPTPA